MLCIELMSSIKLLKLYAWEKLFSVKVQKSREQHVKLLTKGACLAALLSELYTENPEISLQFFQHWKIAQCDSTSCFLSQSNF